MKELINSSHHAVMITGDNPLTACHVAKELKFSKDNPIVILTKMEKSENLSLNGPDGMDADDNLWQWQTVDGLKCFPANINEANKREFENYFLQLVREYAICITGEGFTYLQKNMPKLHERIIPHVKVYARFAPKQKELVITGLRDRGFTVLMCGDGTNDVGALKHAHCGVAILSNAPKLAKKIEQDIDTLNRKNRKDGSNEPLTDSGKTPISKNKTATGKKLVKRGASGPGQTLSTAAERSARHNAAMQRMLAEIEEAEQAQIVKLGDASIAAPFTSKHSSKI